MKKLRFSKHIHAPVAAVWDTMLAPDTYRTWTSAFIDGSYYEGSWAKGEKIRFLSPDGEGMVGRIADGGTHLEIELDATSEFEPYLQEAWPKALAKLKQLCEPAPR